MTSLDASSIGNMPPATRLTEATLAALAQPSRPRKLSDGQGLVLLANPNGSRYWRFTYKRPDGKSNMLSLGVYPGVTLDEARNRAGQMRAQLAAGIDPSEARKVVASQAKEAAARKPPPGVFLLSSKGSLIVELPGRAFTLTAAETRELRAFLSATSALEGVHVHGH